MTLEVLPSGVKCNLSCTYCYQEPMRRAGNQGSELVFEKVLPVLEKYRLDFTMFGGEALLTPIPTLEKFFIYGLEKFGHNSVQTNGTILTDKHIEIFKKYKVVVGASIDGPGELNNSRCANHTTNLIINNIKRLCAEGIWTSLIITIHKHNAEKILRLIEFIDEMLACGIRGINLHNLEIDNEETREELMLDDEMNFLTFRTLYDYLRPSISTISPFSDITSLLSNNVPTANCVWTACDPLTTPAVQGIAPDGHLANCGRTNKDGIDWVKSDSQGKERYLALAYTPQECGGCNNCQYFFACKGQCPGTAIDGDWRNRSKDCRFWYQLMDYIADDMRKQGRPLLDFGYANTKFLNSLGYHSDSPHADVHGDHTDIVASILGKLIHDGKAERIESPIRPENK